MVLCWPRKTKKKDHHIATFFGCLGCLKSISGYHIHTHETLMEQFPQTHAHTLAFYTQKKYLRTKFIISLDIYIFHFSTPLTYFWVCYTDYFVFYMKTMMVKVNKEDLMSAIIFVFLCGYEECMNFIVDWWWFVQKSQKLRKKIQFKTNGICVMPWWLIFFEMLWVWNLRKSQVISELVRAKPKNPACLVVAKANALLKRLRYS